MGKVNVYKQFVLTVGFQKESSLSLTKTLCVCVCVGFLPTHMKVPHTHMNDSCHHEKT